MNKGWLADFCTAMNITMGTVSILCTWQHEWIWAAWAILAAAVADGLDGRVARFFGVADEFGKELDSLCDVVSFGVAPGVLLYALEVHTLPYGIGALAAVSLAVCGALRLARFNISTDVVHGYFMGMPIPTTGCLAATYVLAGAGRPVWLVALCMFLAAWAMISRVHYPDFKGKSADVMQKKAVAATLVIGAVLVWDTPASWAFVLFFMYFLFGILNTCWNHLAASR